MRKIASFCILIFVGIILSQFFPGMKSGGTGYLLHLMTMTALAHIMLRVGNEFTLDKSRKKEYVQDYFVAMLMASLPWLFVAGYFFFVLSSPGAVDGKKLTESLLIARFAAPTSAGVLFAMLAAAGLSSTWVYRKARLLAVFDDVDTILLMIPLKIALIGLAWQLGVVAVITLGLAWLCWCFLDAFNWSFTPARVALYAAGIVLACEALNGIGHLIDASVSLHIECLLPAFVMGAMVKPAKDHESGANDKITGLFMLLVGLSMPSFVDLSALSPGGSGNFDWSVIAWHVAVVTLLANLGKLVPLCFSYRTEATWRSRLALGVGMLPRGEVGSGVLLVSMGFGIGGQVAIIAMLSLVLNLLCTGFFIATVCKLLNSEQHRASLVQANPGNSI